MKRMLKALWLCWMMLPLPIVPLILQAQAPPAKAHQHNIQLLDFHLNQRAVPMFLDSIDGDKVRGRFQTKYEVALFNLKLTSDTQFYVRVNNEAGHVTTLDRAYFDKYWHQNYWTVLFCQECKVIYAASHEK